MHFDSENPEKASYDGSYYSIDHTMSINDKASYTIGNKKGAHDAPENLEDEMLRLIMNP